MQTNFFGLMSALILIGICVVSFFTFSDNFLTQNGATQSVYEDEELFSEVNEVKGEVSDYLSTSNNAEAVLSNSSISQGGITGQNILFQSVAGMWIALKNAPVVVYNLSLGLIKRKLFPDNEFAFLVDAFAALITLAIIIAVIYFATTGQGGKNQ